MRLPAFLSRIPLFKMETPTEQYTRILKKNKRLSGVIQEQRQYFAQLGQDSLKQAVMLAEDVHNPNRYMLLTIYKHVLKDLHLRSQMRTAINKVICEAFALVKKGSKDIDEPFTRFFEKQWFEDVRRYYLEHEFWGHSLIEFGEIVPNQDPASSKAFAFTFKDVRLFPREHVNPNKGLILIYPQDTQGIPFREAPFNEWLLEAGRPDDLGLLEAASIYSIYKRYSLSDWSRSSEKFGDPLLIVRSSSDDDEENRKKASFAASFGNNGWAIFDNDDVVELLERKNDKGYQIFADFLKYLDGENSKGANGQTGSSDERAFVGAANVHERILEAYTEERLRSMTYWINEIVFPFLIAKGFDALKNYEFKPLEFMREKIIPGTEPMAQPDPNNPQGAGGSPVKKSLSLNAKVEALYHIGCTDPFCGHTHQPVNITMSVGMDPIIQRALRRLYDRKVKRGDVDSELVDATLKELWAGMQSGWQQDIAKVPFASSEHLIYLQMRYNTAITSIFKNHTHNIEIMRELFDDTGKIRSWSQFKKAALKISTKYNKEWLQAEYQTAEASARMAKKWNEYVKKGGKLKYMTIGDGKVREEHRPLHGVVKPVNDVFWNSFYPPNGWRCRCYVRWMPEDEPDVEPVEIPTIPTPFLNNVGKTGEIFNGEHPYFDNAGSLRPNRIKLPLSPAQMQVNTSLFRAYQANADFSLIATDNQNGGFAFAHRLADRKDLVKNRTAAKALITEGNVVEIREHLDTPGVKNPELMVNGNLSDVKAPITDNGFNAVYNSFSAARNQGLSEFVLYLQKDYTPAELAKGLAEGFRRKRITKVTLVRKSKVVQINRRDFEEGVIDLKLQGLK